MEDLLKQRFFYDQSFGIYGGTLIVLGFFMSCALLDIYDFHEGSMILHSLYLIFSSAFTQSDRCNEF